MKLIMRRILLWGTVCLSFVCAAAAAAQRAAIRLDVDATDAPRKMLHAHLVFPAQPGKVTLLYPKWIPGEHGPNGPITDVVDLKFSAAGKTLTWQRDAEDMFAFRMDVPAGTEQLDADFNFLLPPSSGAFSSSASSTAKLLDLSWNHVVLYPEGSDIRELQYTASLKLPTGWQFGTALPIANRFGATTEFKTVSLERLVDSPVIAGEHFRTFGLAQDPPQFLHVVADSDAALALKPEDQRHFSHLVAETGALFGARHYDSYHFLLTLSEHVGHFGLEHHESSDNRQPERYLVDEDLRKVMALLLPHEMTHSWNGKYRRPAGLATTNFHQPMKGELLWVYEGLTDYYGLVLAARSGLWTNQNFREWLAIDAARLDYQAGRKWRPLADTTIAAQLLYLARGEGTARRRSVDFYPEGDLIWLEADTLIRQKTDGRRSLDDFCKKFHGGESGPPKVVPYTIEEIVRTLNEIASYDWNSFFQSRVYNATPRAPLGGIEASGWQLAFTNSVPDMLKSIESAHKGTDMSFSLGFAVKEDGGIADVIPDSPADKGGMAAAMKLLAVNGRHWSPTILREAVKAAKTNTAPIELLVENEDYFKTCKLDYHDGERYPILVRDSSKPDLLESILKSITPAP